MASKIQFKFQCKVVIHTGSGTLTYQYGKMANSVEIHFTVPFSSETEKHITEITLYNINPGHFNSIKKGNKVELYAGYDGDVGLLVSGTVYRTTLPTMEDADTAYVIRVMEGQDYSRKPKLNLTFANGTYAKTIMQQVTRKSGINLHFVSFKTNKKYGDGYTADDHPMDVLSEIADDCKSSLFYLRGQLTMRYIYDGSKSDSFSLNNGTGLISVSRESRDDDWVDGDDDDGLGKWSYEVESILNYHLTTFAWVQIKNKYVNAGVMVANGEHSFDGTEPRTNFEGVAR